LVVVVNISARGRKDKKNSIPPGEESKRENSEKKAAKKVGVPQIVSSKSNIPHRGGYRVFLEKKSLLTTSGNAQKGPPKVVKKQKNRKSW